MQELQCLTVRNCLGVGWGGGVLIQNQVLINFYLSVHVFKVGTYFR